MVTEYEKSCRYGFFVHYVACGAVYKDGTRPADIQEAADRFDVPGFVRDIAAMKVDYLIFTAWHFRMMPLYPSAVTEAVRPETMLSISRSPRTIFPTEWRRRECSSTCLRSISSILTNPLSEREQTGAEDAGQVGSIL